MLILYWEWLCTHRGHLSISGSILSCCTGKGGGIWCPKIEVGVIYQHLKNDQSAPYKTKDHSVQNSRSAEAETSPSRKKRKFLLTDNFFISEENLSGRLLTGLSFCLIMLNQLLWRWCSVDQAWAHYHKQPLPTIRLPRYHGGNCLRVSLLWRDTMTKPILIKENI